MYVVRDIVCDIKLYGLKHWSLSSKPITVHSRHIMTLWKTPFEILLEKKKRLGVQASEELENEKKKKMCL